MKDAAIRNPQRFQAEEKRLRAAGQWQGLLDLYAARAGVVGDREQEQLYYRAGEVAQDELADLDLAQHYFHKSLRVRKTYAPAIAALKSLLDKSKNVDGMREVLELEATIAAQPRRVGQIHFELGQLLHQRDPAAALEAYAKAIEAYPRSRAPLDPLESLARKLKRWGTLVQAYEELAAAAKTPKQQAVYHFLRATVLDERLKNPRAAAEAFRLALEAQPTDPRILQTIGRFFERREDWPAFSKALWQSLDVAKQPKEKGQLLLRQAQVLEKHLGQGERAQRLLLKALDLRPQDPQVIKRLFLLARSLDDARGMATALEHEARLPDLKPAERAERLVRAAEQRDRAKDGKLAFQDIQEAVQLRPKNARALKVMERVTRRLGNWPAHAETLARQLELLDPERSANERKATLAILWRQAELCERRLDDEPAARDALARIVEIAPDERKAWNRLEALARKALDFPAVAEILEQAAERATTDGARLAALRELASVRYTQLEDLPAAAATYQRILAQASDDEAALGFLAQIHGALGAHAERAEILTRLAELRRGAARAEVLRQLAELQLEQLAAPADARVQLEAALAAEEEDGAGASLATWKLLAKVAQELEDGALQRQALDAFGRFEQDPETRRWTRIQLAVLEEQAGNPDLALSILDELLETDPGDLEAVRPAVRLLVAQERREDATARLEAAALALDDRPAAAADALRELARLLAEEPGEEEPRLRRTWERVFTHQPNDPEALDQVIALGRAEGELIALHALLEAQESRVSVRSQRQRLWRELADLAAGELERPGQAVTCYERILDEEAEDRQAQAALRVLYRELGRWGDLAELLQRVAADATGEPAEQASHLRELAAVAQEELGDLPRAAEALETLLREANDAEDPAWGQLAGIYAQLQRFADQATALERQAERTAEAEPRAARWAAAATVCSEQLRDTRRAAQALSNALEAVPDSLERLAALARIQEAASQPKRAVSTLVRAAKVAGQAGDTRAASQFFLQRGRLLEEHLADPGGAEQAYVAAVAADGSSRAAHEALIELLERRARWDRLQAALAAATAACSGKDRALLEVRRGELLAARLQDVDGALAAFDAAEAECPGLAAGRDARVRVLRAARRPEALVEALAARRAAEPLELTPQQQRDLRREEAETRAFLLHDLAGARVLLEESLGEEPDDRPSREVLLRVARLAGQVEPLVEQLEAAAGLEQDGMRRASLLVEAGRVLKARAADFPRAQGLLERALEADPRRVEAVRWLTTIAREQGDVAAQVRWTRREVELAEVSEQRGLLLARLGRLLRDEDPEGARAAFEQALQEDSRQLAALRGLAPLLRRAKAWEPLAETLARLAELEPDAGFRVDRLVKLGEVRLQALERPEAARAAFEQALSLAPRDRRALRGRASTLSGPEHAAELVATLQRELDVTPRAEKRVALGKRIAALQVEQLQDPDGATETLEGVLRLRPLDAAAWSQLREVHMEVRRWDLLAESYEREGRQTLDVKLQEERFRQAAQICEHHLGDLPRAVGLYQEVLERGDPQCLAVRVLPHMLLDLGRGQEYEHVLRRIPQLLPRTKLAAESLLTLAKRALERGERAAAVRDLSASAEHDPEAREALELLARLHEEDDEPALLVEVLKRLRDLAADTPQVLPLQMRIAAVLEERLNDLAGACEELWAADRAAERLESPDVPRILGELARLCRRAGRDADLAEVLGSLAQLFAPTRPEQAARLWSERAQVERDRLKDHRAAIASFQAAFALENDPVLLEPLAALLEQEGQWAELVHALEDEARLADDAQARAAALIRVAELLDEKLGRSEEAIAAWEQVLEALPDHAPAFAALDAICQRTQNRPARARVLEREVGVLRGREDRASAELIVERACAAAALYEELEQPERAVVVLEAARERAPLDARLFAELDRLRSERGEYADLFALLEGRAEASQDADEQARLHERLGRLAEAELGNPEQARAHWEKVLAHDPAHAAAAANLSRLHAEAQAWEDLARVMRVEVEARSAADARSDTPGSAAPELAELYLNLGEVLESRLARPDEAVEAFSRAAALAPDDPRPLRGRERLHHGREEWGALVRVRCRLRELETDSQERAELALAIAEAWERQGDRGEAISALEEALDEVPDDVPVLARLRGLLLEEERWADAAGILAREADAARSRQVVYERRLERASLLVERLDDPEEGIRELERARTLAPQAAEPLLALAPLYAARGDRAREVEVLEARAKLELDDALAGELYARAGALNAEAEPRAAAASYERALQRDPGRAGDLQALQGLYEQLEDGAGLARTLHRCAELAKGAEALEALRRAAQVEEQSLGAKRTAASTLEALLEQAPEDDAALAELARLRGELGQHAAREVLLGRRAVLAEPEARRELLLERARVLDVELGRPAAAAECVREAIEGALAGAGPAGEARRLAEDLIRLEEAAGCGPGLLDALELALTHARDDGDARALKRRVAILAAGPIYRPERALAVYGELYAEAPSDDLSDALLHLYERERRPQEQVAFLEREVERLRGDEAARPRVVQLLFLAASLQQGPLGEPRAAERCLREVLALDPEQETARDGLEALYRVAGLKEELAALLAERAERAQDPATRARALTAEAQVHEEQDAFGSAIDRLEGALEHASDPSVPAPLRGRILRNLVRLYRQERRFEELARTLQVFTGETLLNPGERSVVLAELGGVLERDLGRAEDAAGAFEQALELDPANVPAARGLAGICLRAGQLDKVVTVYEREAAARVDHERHVWLLTQIGQLKQQLGDVPGARGAFEAALTLDAESLVALRGLAETCRRLDDDRALVTVLESLARLAPSTVDRLEATRELGAVQARLGDASASGSWFRKAVAVQPDHVETLRGLAGALRETGERASLVETLERLLKHATDDEEKRDLALEAAGLREALAESAPNAQVQQAHLERALAHAQTASSLAPHDAEGSGAYARVAEKLGRWQVLADATVRLARVVDDPDRSGWMLRRAAKVRSLRLGDARGAAEAYQEAVRINPSDREAWEGLEPLAEELRDDALYLRVQEHLLQLAGKDDQRARVALKLGAHLLRLGRTPRAIDAFCLARQCGRGPLRAQALELLEHAYRADERWEDLALVLWERSKDGRLPNAADLLVERAQILEQRLGRPDLAIEAYYELRKTHPDELVVMRSLERLLSLLGRWQELVAFYESEAQRRGRAGYDNLVLLGRVARDQLDDPELAANALQRAVTLNPSGLDALEDLKDLYARVERWPELLDTLRLEIGLLKDRRTREKRLRSAAQLAEEKLGDLATAERFYREVVKLSPRDRAMLHGLARVQEARGEHRGLVETLQRQLTLVQDRAEALALHRLCGRILWKQLLRPYEALDAYRQVLELEPHDGVALEAMSDILREQGEWAELTRVLEHRAQQAMGEAAVALSLELARVQAERLDRPEPAAAAAEQALAQDPRCRPAAELLVDVRRRWRSADPTALVAALQHLAGLTEGARRAELLVEAADLHRERQQEEAARQALQEAFVADPAAEEVISRLAAIYERASAWDELINTLENGARAAGGFRAGELLARSAKLVEERRGDPKGAEARYRHALKLAPDHLPALRGMIRLLLAQGAATQGSSQAVAEEALGLLDRIAKQEKVPKKRAAALTMGGNVLRDALERFAEARDWYEQALGQEPQFLDALASLAELHYAAGDSAKALRYFERIAGSPDLGGDPYRASDLLWARGACLAAAGQREAAAASYREALRHRPGHLSALEDLGTMLLEDDAFVAAKPVFSELVQRTQPPAIRAKHLLTLAGLHRRAKEPERAIELYREGLTQLPQRHDAHLALGLLLRDRDPPEARRHFEFCLAGGKPEEQAESRLALADLQEVAFGDREAAAGHLQAALQLPGRHRAKAAKRLAEIHGRAERWSDAVHNLKRAIELESEPRALAELYANLARVTRDRVQDLGLARRCFARALELDPTDRKTLESLMRLLEASGDLAAQVQVLRGVAEHAREAGIGDEGALRMRCAEVLTRLKRPQEAVAAYERILALDPKHSGARAALSQLYQSQGNLKELERLQRGLLAEDPFHVSCYQALTAGWGQAGQKDPAGQALQVLVALRAVGGEEAKRAALRCQNLARVKAPVEEEEFAATLVHPSCRGALLELMRHLGELLLRQLPDDLKSHGIGWRTTRHGLDGDAFPQHRLVRRVAELLGIHELDLYWMPDWRRPEPVIGQGRNQPALILCPEVFSGLSESESAFILGRALGPLRMGLQLFLSLKPELAAKVLLAALKGFDPQRSFAGEDERLVRSVTKAVSRAPQPLLQALGGVQTELWRAAERLPVAGFRRGVLLSAARCGMFAAGGMLPAVEAVIASNLSLRGRVPESAQAAIAVFGEIPELKDLAAFAVSKRYLRLRQATLES